MKILIIPRILEERATAYAHILAESLSQKGHKPEIATRRLPVGSPDDDNPAPLFSRSEPPDLVIIIGGDGTILLAIQQMPVQVPILGINCGEVGFLADIEPEEITGFFEAMQGDLSTEQRMRISIYIDGVCVGTALNEALIITDRPAKMLRLLVTIDDVLAESFRADGLIISTPTGSTAYAMSAGGPILDPRVEGFLMIPLAPFMLSNRPHLIHSDRRLSIRLINPKPVKLVLDGQVSIPIDHEAVIDVKKALEPAIFVNTGKNFFIKCNEKLRHL